MEALIFLTITGVLFIIAVTAIDGRQEAARFAQGVRDAQSRMEDIINDASTGFVPQQGGFSCSVTSDGAALSFSGGTYNQGTNQGCIFLGKVLKFEQDSPDFRIITVAGTQKNTSGQEVQNFTEARPTALVGGTTPNLTEQSSFKEGLIVTRVVTKPARGGGNNDMGAFGIFSSFPSYSSDSPNLISGSQTSILVPLPTSTLTESLSDTANHVSGVNDTDANPFAMAICFSHGIGGKKAVLILSAGDRRLSTSIGINDVPALTDLVFGDRNLCP